MGTLELVVWSLAAGAMGMVLLFSLVELATSRSAAGLQGSAYHALSLLFVLLLSGVAGELAGAGLERPLHIAQVLIGPMCNAFGNYWARGWLSAHQRDGLMAAGLRIAAGAAPVAGLLCLALPLPQQLPAAGAICLLNSSVVLWLTVRGWLLGDRLALGMAVAGSLSLPAIAGLYAVALGTVEAGWGLHVAIAACAVLSQAVTGVMIWLRSHPYILTRAENASGQAIDPVTHLYSGLAMVRKLVKAQRRRRRTRRDGAVLAIMVFDVDRLAAQVGTRGVNEVFIAMAQRIQRQVGVVNPVGRYWDHCFVSLVETIPSPAWLRTLGLRVAVALRKPVEVAGLQGERVELRPDIGVGVVHLSRGHLPVEDILHDAQRIAEVARGMASRAAMLDPAGGEVVPVEQANLGPRRHGHASMVPHAIPVLQRPARP